MVRNEMTIWDRIDDEAEGGIISAMHDVSPGPVSTVTLLAKRGHDCPMTEHTSSSHDGPTEYWESADYKDLERGICNVVVRRFTPHIALGTLEVRCHTVDLSYVQCPLTQNPSVFYERGQCGRHHQQPDAEIRNSKRNQQQVSRLLLQLPDE